jgi:hypothetical protein
LQNFSEFQLSYYNTDDGVWIKHELCGWETNLGFCNSLESAMQTAVYHSCK